MYSLIPTLAASSKSIMHDHQQVFCFSLSHEISQGGICSGNVFRVHAPAHTWREMFSKGRRNVLGRHPGANIQECY
jgi:hypothetical protein